jgi:beta-glucosidase
MVPATITLRTIRIDQVRVLAAEVVGAAALLLSAPPAALAQSMSPVAPTSAPVAARPWMNKALSPDERADLLLLEMSREEKLQLLHGPMGRARFGSPKPDGALGSAGYIPGIARLGIPALQEADAGVGVTNPADTRPGDGATALPSVTAVGATWNPTLAYESGALLGDEAFRKGFNVMLAGGANIIRDPRNGRAFEYPSEDPLLTGVMAGATIRGIQSSGVVSTVKHFALNNQETGRFLVDVQVDKAAARESDLLAFEIAIEKGDPASVMCSYNLVNGAHACGNDWLLNKVLKRDWGYRGWVMSDWGGVHGTDSLLHGLDQESGEQFDKEIYFGAALARFVSADKAYADRADDAVRRILRSLFAVGLMDRPAKPSAIDYAAHARMIRAIEGEGIVMLRNQANMLPLANAKRIAIIGGVAEFAVIAGGGSSYVTAIEGPGIQLPAMGVSLNGTTRYMIYHPSSPMRALQEAMPTVELIPVDGGYPAAAAEAARKADVAIIFATQWATEGIDVPDLSLPNGQDALIEAVAKANPRTVVVLETNGPVKLPWADRVSAILASWYPGGQGGPAIADILTGRVNPSGHLPVTFVKDERQLPRPVIDGPRDASLYPSAAGQTFATRYAEGSDVGYRWSATKGLTPQYPFGFGLSYTQFRFADLRVSGGKDVTISFSARNIGDRAGKAVPQIYLTGMPGGASMRLLGWKKLMLAPGENQTITITPDKRLLSRFDEKLGKWVMDKGAYTIMLGSSANDVSEQASVSVESDTIKP